MAWIGKRLYVFIAALVVVAGALVGYVTLSGSTILGWRLGPPPELSESGAEVTVEVDASLPDEIQGELSFRAHGVADYPHGRAQMRYDFLDLTNAAGFLGHLDRFGVFFAEEGTLVEIYREGPPWVVLAPGELAELRVGRLREVALSSPLLLPLLLSGAEEVPSTGEHAATYEVSIGDVEPDDEAQSKVVGLLAELEIEEVEVTAEFEDGFPAVVGYELRFPIEGSRQDAVVTIRTRISRVGRAPIDLPHRDEYRTIAELSG